MKKVQQQVLCFVFPIQLFINWSDRRKLGCMPKSANAEMRSSWWEKCNPGAFIIHCFLKKSDGRYLLLRETSTQNAAALSQMQSLYKLLREKEVADFHSEHLTEF